jgi:hypothetical protein
MKTNADPQDRSKLLETTFNHQLAAILGTGINHNLVVAPTEDHRQAVGVKHRHSYIQVSRSCSFITLITNFTAYSLLLRLRHQYHKLRLLFQVSEAELAPGLLAHQVFLHSAAQVVLNTTEYNFNFSLFPQRSPHVMGSRFLIYGSPTRESDPRPVSDQYPLIIKSREVGTGRGSCKYFFYIKNKKTTFSEK